jgi:sugar phosphate isomerase/epimerase
MRNFSSSIEWLSINTATVRQQWTLPQIIEGCARHGIDAISPWRDQVAACGLNVASRLIRDTGIRLSGYCRGGMFPAADANGLVAAMDDNFRAVDEACELGSPCLVLVVGGLPGALEGRAAHRDIGRSRAQVSDGIARLLEYARPRHMPLAIEPLHPMYAADRACVNTLEQALDICDSLDASTGALGVIVDLYHTWWDPKLQAQIERAGASRLLGFHVCDWLTPTTDLLLDRGMMGDGIIDIRRIRGWMETAGYTGFSEVEIFSARNWWQRPADEVLATCGERHRSVV